MLNTTRLALAIFATTLLFGCRPSMESKVLGSWDAPAIDASNRITFHPDHTFQCVNNGMGGTLTLNGNWRIEGDQLMIRYDDGKTPTSETIVEITSEEMKFRDAEGSFTWKRIR
jgi:Lipocalin-like domain